MIDVYKRQIVLKGTEALEFKGLIALTQLDSITVKGLPQNIPDDLTIDVSNINKVENICLKDVQFPEGIIPEGDPEQVLISIVEAKRTVEELSLIHISKQESWTEILS